MVGAPLLPAHRAELERSRVVHESVDKARRAQVAFPMPGSAQVDVQDDESEGTHKDEEGDEDRVLKGCRPPKAEDGMLSDDELQTLYDRPLRSAYGRHAHLLSGQEYFADRPDDQRPGDWKQLGMLDKVDDDVRALRGDAEPLYTSVTPLWRCTLECVARGPSC